MRSTAVRAPDALRLVALFAGAALIAGFTMLRGVDPFDEGLVLQAARRVADGQLPYRDFLWPYGPAQPYLLGGTFDLVGVSLLGWRIVRVVALAGASVAVFCLARRAAGTRLALVAWLAAACALAQPASANPFPVALCLILVSFLLLAGGERAGSGRALPAGALLGAAAAFRLDFALYGLAGAGLWLALDPGRAGRRVRLLVSLCAPALAIVVLAYLPFVLATGPGDVYDALVGTSLREKEHWTLPFPIAYEGSLRAWPPADLLEDLKDVLEFYVPLLLLIGLGLTVAAAAGRWAGERRPPAAWLGLATFGAGGAAYLLSRTDEFHTAPLLATLAVLLPAVMAWAAARRPAGGRALAVTAGSVLALLALYGVANRLSALFLPPDLRSLKVPVADGVKAPPREARGLRRVAVVVQARVPPGEPIYVAPRRSDLVRFNNPLVYVVSERDNPTRRDFGLLTSAPAQAAIVARLERVRPRVVVRWTDPISSQREPNLRGRASGSRTLDEWIAREYRLVERVPGYDLLVPREGPAA